MTPLYKFLKSNGTSFYAFPGAAEDISAAYQNQNYKMYFSKFVLLNFPKQNLNTGSGFESKEIYWDFENTSGLGYGFVRSNQASPAASYKEQLVESLRNYVANFEVVMKESRLNNTEYYYDNNVLETPTEKIFWKWCKKLNLIDLEPALDGDEYFGNLTEFERGNLNDDTSFKEILWRERKSNSYPASKIYQSNVKTNKMQIEMATTTNIKVGDVIKISNPDSDLLKGYLGGGTFSYVRVTDVVPEDSTEGQRLVTDYDWSFQTFIGTPVATIELVYHKLVQYIGEINGINNVQDKTRSYTEVYAHIPDHTGQTPDILFRTKADSNYKPNLIFPILPSQYQPEILGAELFNSPIVNSPQNYPGDYYAQFDTQDFTYELGLGDSIRKSGEYYGVFGDIYNTIINVDNLDGLTLDFDTTHYAKMNILNRVLTNFEQFNSLQVNNQPPKDFEFNAILWYYTVEDLNGNQASNLYGISILDNPDNNTNSEEIFQGNGLRIPLYKKLAANDNQDGTSYAFSLNLSFNIINENPQDTYNPQAINNLFNFNLFNEAMTNLSAINESFLNIVTTQNKVIEDVSNLKQLLYTQTDLQLINSRISNLENLLKLYSTNQISNSDSVGVLLDKSQSPPQILLNTRDTFYNLIYNIPTTLLYNTAGPVQYVINVPDNKNFLVRIINDDVTNFTLPNNQNLEILINSDLSFRQSMDIVLEANDLATQNKKLDVYLNFKFGNSQIISAIIEGADFPIFFNQFSQTFNSSKYWKENSFEVDLSRDIALNQNSILEVPVSGDTKLVSNSFKTGDIMVINDFIVGTVSRMDFSGQYPITSVNNLGYVYLNVASNIELTTYGSSQSLPLVFNSTTKDYLLVNKPHLDINKGVKFRITRINQSDTSEIKDRYLIERIRL